MQIILPMLPDPTDRVIQGEQIVAPAIPESVSVTWLPMVQGQVIGDKVLKSPVPAAIIGWHALYSLPSKIGPKVMSGGCVVMLDIGTQPVSMFVDPTQAWINSKLPLDTTGAFQDLNGDLLLGAVEPDFYETTYELLGSADKILLALPTPPVLPRDEIERSGLAKKVTASVLSTAFMTRSLSGFNDSSTKWIISGVTQNGANVPIGGCRVVIFQTNKILANLDILANPVVVETVSDGSGNYSVQVARNEQYQIIAYLPGSSDLAGVTVNSVVPVAI